MNSKRFLIKLQFLGFRYHGVQKQTNLPSVQGRIEKKLGAFFPNQEFSTRFSSRTDAMVSAEEIYFLLMFSQENSLLKVMESLKGLPQDINILDTKAVSDDFTMLKVVREKEYRYFFSYGHGHLSYPFASPYMTILNEALDIDLMNCGAKLFEGHHNFANYVHRPKAGTKVERFVKKCEIIENSFFTASFFPEQSFIFQITGESFMRGQIRLMMGALFRLGKKEISLSDLSSSLVGEDPEFVKWMVPPSGLMLHKTILE